jgi:hypothetical protein
MYYKYYNAVFCIHKTTFSQSRLLMSNGYCET